MLVFQWVHPLPRSMIDPSPLSHTNLLYRVFSSSFPPFGITYCLMATILRIILINNLCNLFVISAVISHVSHQCRTTYLKLLLNVLFFHDVHNFKIPSAFCTRSLHSRMQYTSKYGERRLRTSSRYNTGKLLQAERKMCL